MKENIHINLCSEGNLKNASICHTLWQLQDIAVPKEVVGVGDKYLLATNGGTGSKEELSATIQRVFKVYLSRLYDLLPGKCCLGIKVTNAQTVIQMAAPITSKGKIVDTCYSMLLLKEREAWSRNSKIKSCLQVRIT